MAVDGGVGEGRAGEGAGVPLFVAEFEVDLGKDLRPRLGLAEGGSSFAILRVYWARQVFDELVGFLGRGSWGHGVPGFGSDRLAENEELVETDGDVILGGGLGGGSGALAGKGRGEHVVERGAEVCAVVHVAEDAWVEIAEGLDDFVAEGGWVLRRVACGCQGDVVEEGGGFMEGERQGYGADGLAGLAGRDVEGVVVPAGIEGNGPGEEVGDAVLLVEAL